MSSLKKIFSIKKSDPQEIENLKEDDVKKIKLSFFESGYGSSKQAEGNHIIFKACLQDVYMDYKGKCREDEKLQKELKGPYVQERNKYEIELKKRKTVKDIIEEGIVSLGAKISTIKSEIADVKHNPEKYVEDVDKKPKAQFYLGLIVLIPITFYLLVFYISASYSAFFKTFNTDQLTNAIFDANALTKAIDDGWLEGVFVATIPFAFMGLGYLVHMFHKHKNWLSYVKIGTLFIVTFIFDSILAYQIEKKIYDIEKTLNSLDFNVQIAFTKAEFWGIIFAGFVVYIIWGLIFDFIMKEYDNFDKIKTFIRSKREDIKNGEQEIANQTEKLNPIKEEISGIEGKINDLQRTIDGFVFSDKHYLTYHSEYVKGWFLAIADNFKGEKIRNQILSLCATEERKHLEKHDIADESYEGRLYKLIN